MGITAAISFAQSIWSGEDFDIAVKNACCSGIKVGGIAWISSIAAAQLGRTATIQALRPATDWLVKQMGSKASAAIANTLRIGSKPIYGAAAANSASKLLRGNVATGVVTVTVLSSVDFYRMFQGKVSGAQVFKNVTNTTASVAGGTAGWVGGAAAGATLGTAIPIIGTAVGGIIGGVLGSLGGGIVAGKASAAAMDAIITDDAKKMQEILGDIFSQLAEEYLLNKEEAEHVINLLSEKISEETLRNMYKSSSKRNFAKQLIEPVMENVAKQRKHIKLPSSKQMYKETKKLVAASNAA